jgi:hypothetical protein
MEEFTEAEKAYLDLFQRLKEETNQKDVSVFNQPLTTRKELLDTIVVKASVRPVFELVSDLGHRRLNPQEYNEESYPFYTLKEEAKFSDLLCSAIVTYFPSLTLPSFDSLQSPPDKKSDIKAQFLRHYERSIPLLLKGPPHANEHQIDEVRKEQWIRAQKTEKRRDLARTLLEKTLYISHSDLLQKIKESVETVRTTLREGPVTFLVTTPDKSNYYIALLFYYYWNQAGLPLDNVKIYMDEVVPGNVIDIDEAAYSGTQSTGTLAKVYSIFVTRFKQQLDILNIPTLESYRKSSNFLPVALLEKYLSDNNVNYIVLRMFCSENGVKKLLKMPPDSASISFFQPRHAVKPPFSLVIGQLLPSPETLFGKETATKIGLLFGNPDKTPASAAYFNHKVADMPSTYLYAYAYGVVPDKILVDPREDWGYNRDPLPEHYFTNLEANPAGNTNALEFLPFIRHCGKNERLMPRNRNHLFPPENERFSINEKNKELSQDYRCPYAWYKLIDYETGTYPSVPLPYGPKEENFLGGKRKTRRHRWKRFHGSKRKTRSHSK